MTSKCKSKGITLIALVLTIIVLLILSGITIASLIGENGLIGKANQAKNLQIKAEMKEDLILAISDLQIEKQGNATIEDITQKFLEEKLPKYKCEIVQDTENGKKVKLEKDGIVGIFIIDKDFNIKEELTEDKQQEVEKDIPTVGEGVDISVPIEIETFMTIKSNTKNILNLLDVEEINYVIESKSDNVSLENNILIANDKADSNDKCKILITGKYKGQSYKNKLTVFVEPKNRTVVQDKDGNIKEAFAIYKEQDLIRFQEIVTTGANNKCNVKVMNNINLNENLYEFNEEGKIIFNETAKKYNSIGSKDFPFLGIFDGNGKTISGLYIKENEKEASGLFVLTRKESEIKNIKIENSYMQGKVIGGIVAYNEGKIYRCKVEKITIENNGTPVAGGIVAINNGDIIECSASVYLNYQGVGGIVGLNGTNHNPLGIEYNSTIGNVYRCYSTGYIGYREASGIVSHNGVYGGTGYIYDCYSTAKIEDNFHDGAIAAVQSHEGVGGYIYNSYYLNLNCIKAGISTPKYYGNISNSYLNDTSITAEKLNVEADTEIWLNDEKDENGNWKYNNGYPILKWQIE